MKVPGFQEQRSAGPLGPERGLHVLGPPILSMNARQSQTNQRDNNPEPRSRPGLHLSSSKLRDASSSSYDGDIEVVFRLRGR